MPVINIEVLQDVWGGSADVDARITATVNRASIDAYRVNNQFVVFPRDLIIPVVNGLPTQPFVLTALPISYYWHIDVFVNGEAPLRRTVIVPEGDGPFDFEDLIDVDPGTAQPDPGANAYQAWLDQMTAASLHNVPAGGTAGQVLAKVDGEDFNTEWVDQTGGSSGPPFVALPDFLTYAEGRSHLPTLNSNFGWNAEGLWFGNAIGESDTSYPVFTDFTIGQNDAVTVEFNVDIADECSDIGLCVYVDGDTPLWQWGTHSSRIAAQFDCVMPILLGLTEDYQGERSNIPNPGMYRVKFTYNPIGGTPVQFEYYQGSTLINSMTLNETLGAGSYRVGFASDNNNGRTYISDLSIMVNEDTPYTDTLQNGNSGAPTEIADFVFDTDGDQSTMTIHNHDMRIQTTRDGTQDSDIDINSADDVWITANDTIELTSTTDEIRFITGENGQHEWRFTPLGAIQLPTTNSAISSGVDGDYVIDQRSLTAATDYSAGTPEFTDRTSFIVYTDADSQWFVANTPSVSNRALITFADLSTVTTIAVYNTNQEPAGVVFQWDAPLTKTAQDIWPLTISGTVTEPRNYTALDASDAQWRFLRDGTVQFPGQDSNNRTGNGEVLQFGNPNQQSIITGSKPTLDNPTAQRLVVAGQDGVQGTNFDGEGGDIYLWAGVGGGTTGTGGDIKVDAGNGSLNGNGGTVKVRGGYSTNGNGGFIDIYAGDSSMASGGNVNIAAGTNQSVSEAVGGSVYIYGGGSADANAGGTVGLYTYQNGKIILSGDGGEFLNDSAVAENQIAALHNVHNADYLGVDTTNTTAPTVTGKMAWNDADGTIDLKLKDGVTLQVGQETVVMVANYTGSLIPEGSAVHVSGAQGQRLKVALASASSEAASANTIGIVTQSGGIAHGSSGYVTTQGIVHDLNLPTSTFSDGDLLWLSTTAGQWSPTRPQAPNHGVQIGYVINASNGNAGSIYVHTQNGYELDELHNVNVDPAASTADNEVLAFDSATSTYINQTAAEAGLVAANSNAVVKTINEAFTTINGATGVVAHDYSTGAIFNHTAPAANFTVNITNLVLASGYGTSITLVINQGATARIPSALQIAGSAQTINWQGGSAPTGNANKKDVVSFSILNVSGTYTVLGQLVSFG